MTFSGWEVNRSGNRTYFEFIPYEDTGQFGNWFNASEPVKRMDPRIFNELLKFPNLAYDPGESFMRGYRNRSVIGEALAVVAEDFRIGSGFPDEKGSVKVFEPGVPRRVLVVGRTDYGNHVLMRPAYEDERCNKRIVCPVPVRLDLVTTFERI